MLLTRRSPVLQAWRRSSLARHDNVLRLVRRMSASWLAPGASGARRGVADGSGTAESTSGSLATPCVLDGAFATLGIQLQGPVSELFARPNTQALELVMRELHWRHVGKLAARKVASEARIHARRRRTKRSALTPRHLPLQALAGVWPIKEPQQSRAFRQTMQAWVSARGLSRHLPFDVAQSFPVAYQSASGPRTLQLLLWLAAPLLAKEAAKLLPQGWADDLSPSFEVVLSRRTARPRGVGHLPEESCALLFSTP